MAYRSGTYERDLVACRNVLARCVVERRFESATDLAASAGLSYGTVAAFFAGSRQCSLEVADLILAELRVRWGDVHRRVPAAAPTQ